MLRLKRHNTKKFPKKFMCMKDHKINVLYEMRLYTLYGFNKEALDFAIKNKPNEMVYIVGENGKYKHVPFRTLKHAQAS